MADGEIADFALLLEYVAEIPGIERIRYTTSHPKEFTQRLIDAYARIPKLVSHVHLPVQSGSDRILGAMKRGYTALEYKSIVRRLRAVRPDISHLVRFHRRLPRRDRGGFRRDDEADRGRRLRRQLQLRLQPPAPARRPRTSTTTRRTRSSSRGCSACRRRSSRRPHAISGRMVGTRPARAGRRRARRRTRRELAARTDNNRVVNFAGPQRLIGHFVDVDDHRRAAALAARAHADRRTGLSLPKHALKRKRSNSPSPRSTTSAWPTCAACSTRTCARSRPRST